MDWFVFWERVKENLNWIIPSITSLFFAIVTTVLIFKQAKWQKIERKINTEFMAHQSNLQEAQICIELMDKRLSVYEGVKNTIGNVLRDNQANNAAVSAFRANTLGIEFYFGNDIEIFYKRTEALLKDLILVSMKVNDVLEGRREDKNHSENVDRQEALVDDFIQLSKDINPTFEPYLGFSNYKIH